MNTEITKQKRSDELHEFKIGAHCQKFPGDILHMLSTLEILDYPANIEINRTFDLVIDVLNSIVNVTDVYTASGTVKTKKMNDNPEARRQHQNKKNQASFVYRATIGSILHDYKHLRTHSPLLIFMDAIIDKYWPRPRRAVWFASLFDLTPTVQKMLQGVHTKYNQYGFPTTLGSKRFQHKYGFIPIVRAHLDTTALKYQMGLIDSVIDLIGFCVYDDKKMNWFKLVQWKCFLKNCAKCFELMKTTRSAT